MTLNVGGDARWLVLPQPLRTNTCARFWVQMGVQVCLLAKRESFATALENQNAPSERLSWGVDERRVKNGVEVDPLLTL